MPRAHELTIVMSAVGQEMAAPKTGCGMVADSRMPVAEIPLSDKVISEQQSIPDQQGDAQSNDHDRIHRLLTSNFGFGDNRNERISQVTNTVKIIQLSAER